jgi:uncharacterized protein (TIGR02421 family)
MSETRLAELDAALPGLARKIRVLDAIAWPDGIEDRFLADWRAGRPRLPEVVLAPRDHGAEIEALENLAGQCDSGHPAGSFLAATARSYACAGRMLGAIGTPAFTEYSARLYQRPDHYYERQRMTPLDAAHFFLDTTDALLDSRQIPATEADIPAEDFAAWMRTEVDRFFGPDQVRVVLDPDLASKAIAGATRIRLRASARFSELDKAQLLQHEAFVHVGTALNGRAQPRLTSLSLGAPRTTQTQEGIAMLAELLTGSIDIQRLRRIALRVVAVQQALDGADFHRGFQGLPGGRTIGGRILPLHPAGIPRHRCARWRRLHQGRLLRDRHARRAHPAAGGGARQPPGTATPAVRRAHERG